jgi:adenylate cyclase
MFRLTLRNKLLLFAIVIAIVPLLVAGRAMIRIAGDELKSSVNEQLVSTAEELAHEIDTFFERTWLTPLLLIRNAIDDESLGVEEKIALLKAGVADSPDIVALQVTVDGSQVPLL